MVAEEITLLRNRQKTDALDKSRGGDNFEASS